MQNLSAGFSWTRAGTLGDPAACMSVQKMNGATVFEHMPSIKLPREAFSESGELLDPACFIDGSWLTGDAWLQMSFAGNAK